MITWIDWLIVVVGCAVPIYLAWWSSKKVRTKRYEKEAELYIREEQK